MISVVKNDSELDTKANAIEENQARVSGDTAESPEEEKPRVSSIEDENNRVLEVNGSVKEEVIKPMAVESDVDREIEEEDEKAPSFVQFESHRDEFDVDAKNDRVEYSVPSGDSKVEVYTSLLSEFDDFVANEKHGAMEATSRALSYGFEVGDMVWGKVKSHPWWPGHIFNETFASSSVRRTRREGYVLVAFFGDSSYGWFDPAELIPFDSNYAEKSQQTNSRTFVKAVEEAVDEACRRCGLGVTCRCRNKYNFRQTNLPGYFEVDVPDFEPRGVYSVNQIKKAQNAFLPDETLAYLKRLALAPQDCNENTLDFMKNKARVCAFRKALFEEFDETYAQAFGVQPKRTADDPANASDHSVKTPTRVPLSGPLVIAEALGTGKSSKKSAKVKDQSKKDRYLFKRRDESVDSRILQLGQRLLASSASTAYEEGSSAVAASDYVLQKRVSKPVSAKPEHTGIISNEVASSSEEVVGKEAVILDQDRGYTTSQAPQVTFSDEVFSLDKVVLEKQDKPRADVMVEPTSKGQFDNSTMGAYPGVTDSSSPSIQHDGEATTDIRLEESAKVSRLAEGSVQTQGLSTRVEGNSLDKLQVGFQSSNLSTADVNTTDGISVDVPVKKAKMLKRPLESLGSENSLKKKKKKKVLGTETSPDRPKKNKAGGALAGKSALINVASREDLRGNLQRKDTGNSNALFSNVGPLSVASMRSIELELPQLLGNLHSLALNPYHGSERYGHSLTIQFFLRFRSQFFQKSLALSPPPEADTAEIRTSKPPSSVGMVSENSGSEKSKDLASSKPAKSLVRPDDPTRVGRKRLPSDRQEEITAKKLKKRSMLKSLAAERKAVQRSFETPRIEPAATAPAKPIKSDSFRKTQSQQLKPVEPTMLVIKFPPQTNLPSMPELKAKFARFGPIDQSASRVFWQTSTCRVVFRHKHDAQLACKYAMNNSTLFGNLNARYSVREVGGAPAAEAPPVEADKGREEEIVPIIEAPRAKNERLPPLLSVHPQSNIIQPKSILKKPIADEAGNGNGNGNGGRATTRVKFLLGGEETVTPSSSSSRNFNSYGDGGSAALASSTTTTSTTTTSVAMDFISKNNFQKVIPLPASASASVSIPTQYTKYSHNNSAAPTRNLHNHSLNIHIAPPPQPPTMDISQQMISLLTRCNDVVASVTGLLGYVPYHPL